MGDPDAILQMVFCFSDVNCRETVQYQLTTMFLVNPAQGPVNILKRSIIALVSLFYCIALKCNGTSGHTVLLETGKRGSVFFLWFVVSFL